jgi:predicted house-cleaning NTP pyrophosphatase (Maf/HAM1 superfamily)
VARLEGSYDNVVGLPLATVDALLRDLGYRWLDFVDPAEE